MTLPAQQRRAASGFANYCDTLFQLERFSEVYLEQLLRQINEDPRLEPWERTALNEYVGAYRRGSRQRTRGTGPVGEAAESP